MSELNTHDTRELNVDELESVSGGFIWGNVAWDAIKYVSDNGFIANAVRATGNTPGKT